MVGCLSNGDAILNLESICRIMQKAMRNIHPPTLLLAALLSGVTIGSHAKDAERDQIHILLTCHGHDPFALTLLDTIAAVLSPLNSICNFHKGNAGICETKQAAKISSGATQEVHAGRLCLSRKGISVVNMDHMSKAERKECLHYLNAGTYFPCDGPEFGIPVTTTLWGVIQSWNGQKASQNDENAAQHYPSEISDAFDVVIPFSVQNDPLYDQHSIQRLLSVTLTLFFG